MFFILGLDQTRSVAFSNTFCYSAFIDCIVYLIISKIFSHTLHFAMQEERHGRISSDPTLTAWVQDQQRRNPGKILSLVVVDLEKYFR